MMQAANVREVDRERRLWQARRDLKSDDWRERDRALRLIDHLAREETRQCWTPGLGRSPVIGGIPGANPKSIANSATLRGWWRSDLGISQTGGVVDAWADLSGNGYGYGSGGTRRPAFESSGFLGWPSLLFDGVDDILINQGGAATAIYGGNDTPFACYLVFELITLGATGSIVNGCTTANGTHYMGVWANNGTTYSLRQAGGGQLQATGAPLSAGTKYVLRYFYSGTAATLRVNNTAVFTATAQDTSALVLDTLAIGAWYSGGGPSQCTNIRVAEQAYYSAPLAAEEDARMSGYFFNRYGISNS